MKKIFLATFVAATALLSACDGGNNPKPSLSNEVDSLSYALGVANSPTEQEIIQYLLQSGSDSTFVDDFFKGLKDGMNASNDKKDIAYRLGMQSGLQIKQGMFAQIESQVFAGDSTKHLSEKQFLAGMLNAKNGNSGLVIGKDTMTRESIQPVLQDMMKKMSAAANEKLFGEAKKKSEDYIAKMAKTPGVQELAGGVYYKEIKAGTGATPKADEVVEVQYEGKLINGTVFDSSNEKTVEFGANQVIKGWTIALTHMKVGSEWEVYIPWNLAYGEQAQGPIPPFSALIFKIKLVGVKPAAAPSNP
ncbi:MAG: FKBP-type peptidyl-prolyl cis-trans isomerase [Bacteroidales bacterium]|nr:FKBP-type peptidyl-prolyl cis-trans isomerase [Bacteroidales bacterium]